MSENMNLNFKPEDIDEESVTDTNISTADEKENTEEQDYIEILKKGRKKFVSKGKTVPDAPGTKGKPTTRKADPASADSIRERTSCLTIKINSLELREALSRRLFLMHESSLTNLIKQIYAEHYGVEVKLDPGSQIGNERIRIVYFPDNLENAFLEDYARRSKISPITKTELRTLILREAVEPELASVKNGISREDCGEWIKKYRKEKHKKEDDRTIKTSSVKKRNIQKIIAEMDPVVLAKNYFKIKNFLLNLEEHGDVDEYFSNEGKAK